MFCSTDLAARIERAERRLVDTAAVRHGDLHPEDGVGIRPIAGGLAVYAGAQSPLTKVVALGFAGIPDSDGWSAVEAMFDARRHPVQLEVASLADPALLAGAAARGYRLEGFENIHGCPLAAATLADHPPVEGIAVVRSDPAAIDGWVRDFVDAFAVPDTQGVTPPDGFPKAAMTRTIRSFTDLDSMVRYTARLEGGPAGTGAIGGAAMRVDRDDPEAPGIAQLCGAAVLPRYRCRGGQSALLATRLHEALAAGCDLAVMTTLPGSRSEQNAHRCGFRLLYTRAILVRPVPGS